MGNRILAITLPVFALMFTLFYIVDYSWHERNMFEELALSSEVVSDLLQHAVEEPMKRGNDAGTTEQFRLLSRFPFVRVFLTNHKGNVTYSTQKQTQGKSILSLYASEKFRASVLRTLAESGSASQFVTLDHRPFFAEMTTVPNQPSCHHCHGSSRKILGSLILLTDVSRQREKLAGFHSQRTLLFLFGASALLAGLLIYIKCYVVNRIRTIERTAQEVMDGNLAVNFQVRGEDELATLSTHLTSMVRARRQAEEELEALNRKLEDAVRERTQELLDRSNDLEQANRRLQELDRMKSDFLATVSHELKTPLTSVRGFTSILDKLIRIKLLPELETIGNPKLYREAKRVKNNLAILDTEAARLQKLILEVIDMADLTSGKVDWSIERIDLLGLAEERAEAFRARARAQDLDLQVVCAKRPPIVRTDRAWVSQVLDQFLDNAMKFTASGGVLIRLDTEAEEALVEVRDTGAGISPTDLENIFESFRQLGDQLTAKPQGAGLGLSICREIITRLGGRIWAASEQDKGASFFFTLPLTSPENDADPSGADSGSTM